MNIAIDARGINLYRGTGIGTYTENLVRELLNIDEENSYTLYWYGNNYKDFIKSNTKINIVSKGCHSFFEKCYFPENIIKNSIEIYHVPQNGIGLDQNVSCIKVSTVHDLIPYIMPETVGKGYLLKFLKNMPFIIENSDAILTVSEYSKKDILKYFPINEDKIYVTPLAANYNYKPLSREHCKKFIEKNYSISDPFVLYLGGFSKRKNVRNLILAFADASKKLSKKHNLVIIGLCRDELESLKDLCRHLNISNEVIFTGYIGERFLPVFYNACELFVYPSLYEGFGLPVLEAMSCKTPVVTSNISSIPEIAGDSAVLINPLDTSELRDAILNILEDSKLKQKLSIEGFNRSRKFSWKNTSKKTLEAYSNIYNTFA
ncbi:glycosyltransferase involved in cell wall biosynthesis [Clostridium acetobutylicum]|uniref:Glycosyltransferase n=1 Tax=Clostridium acetobutylicum (strain ATCC 824 / DSM 792 / JCM 1419 / IAM 19013 / LMG 5710 / NBRC 13948 / NRRL B-527 / VKM B-1787 / 2291 / W) TaxID=272562 RepID=Q97F42_CLOAB|nr:MULTISPECIES: glycosyltransferase family 1 protein [Clostridium]AAK80853.1 Glycosyltransferase [Clostridium acetobutylicum ATCC 824]ADZ21955.1 Glycosyltransferase [Clostridium acetobutylicum EA 2018]AEI32605.1 glycosyltransferase [Clostridium acetobutylicum DSM 1731]AWV78735.1 glycosyltransferase family 1 protein [Clostridium acetobutylicum]MBC2393598.1 glycosyltransferase family 4 protein [Clostridium acetobutylicum]